VDFKRYIESELAEEEKLGLPASTGEGADEPYPGDERVHVPGSAVLVEEPVAGAKGVAAAYVARPLGGDRLPGLMVIHENKGLVPYIRNTTRRLAKLGYVAAAPDLLAPFGGTRSFGTPSEAILALKERDQQALIDDVRHVIAELSQRDDVDATRVGIIGFCFGGGVAWRVLTQEPQLAAGVPFYGPSPSEEDVPRIQAPVLAVYGELDERITSQLPAIRAAMDLHGKHLETLVVPGAQHAFHNDTNPDRYDADAAGRAWEVALDFLAMHLRRVEGRPRRMES
jgi:carboxymethylenebutenolidase